MQQRVDGDAARAAALASLDILDTAPERAFDDIVFIAAQTCAAPIALVSLLDRERQWFKARVGLDACETPIDQSVCQLDIDRAELLEIRDLTRDPRTRDNVLVTGESALRFYAGAPLVTRDGVVIGRLCVIDLVPRPAGLTAAQRALLEALGRQVGDQLELRHIARTSHRMLALQGALIDIADRVRRSRSVAEMTREAAAIVGRVLDLDRAGFGSVDDATEIVDIEADWTAPGVASITGRHRFADFGDIRTELASGAPLVIHDVHTDPRTAADPAAMTRLGIGALVNVPVREHGATIAVFIVQTARPRAWTDTELDFLRSVADRLEAGVSRLRLDEQQQAINGEISHRLKNMLAMVQALATHTLRGVADRAPIQTFEKRLVALSHAHDVLMRQTLLAADIGEVAGAGVAQIGMADRIAFAGPPVALGPRAAFSFALLLHELLTNACKYGAFAAPDGRVTLGWGIEEVGGRATLVVRWRESGGPPVLAPTRTGFGSRLIRLGILGTGGVDLRYKPAGLEADLHAIVSHLSQA